MNDAAPRKVNNRLRSKIERVEGEEEEEDDNVEADT
jgi:hypothetical protein